MLFLYLTKYFISKFNSSKFCFHEAPLGHMSEMPAASCMKIAERQGGKVISGLYWLGEALAPFLVRFLWTVFSIHYFSSQEIKCYHNKIFIGRHIHAAWLGGIQSKDNEENYFSGAGLIVHLEGNILIEQ